MRLAGWLWWMARRAKGRSRTEQIRQARTREAMSRKKSQLVKGHGGDIKALFSAALGLLGTPWQVSSSQLDADGRRIDLQLDCDTARLSCPHCGTAEQPVHDRVERQWRHLDFFQFEAWLHARVPRVGCTHCGKTTQVEVPWAREGSGMTLLLEAMVLELCAYMPVRKVASMLRMKDKQIWRRIEHYVAEARAKVDMSQVKHIGIDEREHIPAVAVIDRDPGVVVVRLHRRSPALRLVVIGRPRASRGCRRRRRT